MDIVRRQTFAHVKLVGKCFMELKISLETNQNYGLLITPCTHFDLSYFRAGIACDQCLTFPGCVNGNCTSANECNCQDGWNGAFCDIRKLLSRD